MKVIHKIEHNNFIQQRLQFRAFILSLNKTSGHQLGLRIGFIQVWRCNLSATTNCQIVLVVDKRKEGRNVGVRWFLMKAKGNTFFLRLNILFF